MPLMRFSRLLFLLLLLTAAGLAGCDRLPDSAAERTGTLVSRGTTPRSATTASAPPSPPVNRIAFIGADRNMYTVSPDGSARAALTTDALRTRGDVVNYQHFAWSPDSAQVSFVRLGFQAGDSEAALLTAPAAGGAASELFTSSEIFPFYLHWSPDSSWISFLSNAPDANGIGLYLSSPAGGAPTLLDQGQPFYWTWSPDSSLLFIHTGARDQGRLAFLSPDSATAAVDLDLQPTAFQAPAWSPTGDGLLLAIERENGDALVLINESGEIERELAAVGGNTAFTLSPDGGHVAYIEGRPLLGAGTIGSLQLLPIGAPDEVIAAPDQLVLSFFWSPDSSRLVYFAIDDGSKQQAKLRRTQNDSPLTLGVYVLDVTDGETRYLGAITPTEQFLNVVPYFDQYHGSATIWSPDSSALVIPSLNEEDEAELWIYAADGAAAPRFLAEGFLAFWSWR